jgi:hypothetical protein
MKVLILIGMLIIFISAFFSFFIFDTLIRDNINCGLQGGEGCDGSGTGLPLMFGLMMIVFFIIIDILVVYVILKSIASGSYSSVPDRGSGITI